MNGMSFPRLALLLLVMAGVTYLMRVLSARLFCGVCLPTFPTGC